MDKLEIIKGSFIQQTQYFIPVEIDLSVVPPRLGIWFFHLSRRTTLIQDLLVRRQFSLVPDNRTNVYVEAWPLHNESIVRWAIFKKMKTLCDIEGEISIWTNWHNFGRKIMSIWYIFQIQFPSAIYKDKIFFSSTFISNKVLKW